MPFVVSIRVYPIKSLDPVELASVRVTRWGTLEYDRVYAIFDEKNRFVNGKREPRIQLIRTRYELGSRRLTVYASWCCSNEEVFELDSEIDRFSKWLSSVLGYQVSVKPRWEGGFPDDQRYNGPTIVSTSTLSVLASWFPGWDLRQARLRVRANIEIAGVQPFWEDKLNAYSGRPVRVRIGGVLLECWNISRRCVVPSRDPFTGAATQGFVERFMEKRPPVPGLSQRDKFRLAVNTRIDGAEEGKAIKLLDTVEVLDNELPASRFKS